MLKLSNHLDGSVVAQVVDRDSVVLTEKVCKSEAEALGYFSHLSATITEGYRNDIVRA